MSKLVICVLSLGLLLAFSATAQEAGQIVGTVRDGSGAVVQNVKVTATESVLGSSNEYVSASSNSAA